MEVVKVKNGKSQKQNSRRPQNRQQKVVWTALEHRLLQELGNRRSFFSARRLWVLVSGGLDSVLLWETLKRLEPVLQYRLGLLHFHHGGNLVHRNQALEFCLQLSQGQTVKVFRSPAKLESEAEMRRFRQSGIREVLGEDPNCWWTTAHHAEDQLETRLLRLIRGCGPRGILGMQKWNERLRVWRPFLDVGKKDLLLTTKRLALAHVEDPSNHTDKYLRNWIRRNWLPALEKHSPGATKSLQASLRLLAREVGALVPGVGLAPQTQLTVDYNAYLGWDSDQQSRVLAESIAHLGIANCSQGLIREMQKLLASPSRQARSFQLGQVRLTLDAGLLTLGQVTEDLPGSLPR